MIVLDSSAWLEYLEDGPNAPVFATGARDLQTIVPTIVLFEVGKVIFRLYGEDVASDVVSRISKRRVIPLSVGLAFAAVRLSKRYNLAMADSIIYAKAQTHGAEVWTQDADFDGIAGVRYFPKQIN